MGNLKEQGTLLCVSPFEPVRCYLFFFSLFLYSLIHSFSCCFTF